MMFSMVYDDISTSNLQHLAVSLIDHDTISTYIKLGDSRNSDVLAIILNKYLTFSCRAVKELQHLILHEERDPALKLAHTMKSSAAQVGALQLSSYYQIVEQCAERDSLDTLDEVFFNELEYLHDNVTDALIFILENREQYQTFIELQ